MSELDSRLKRNHAWRTVSTQPHTQQPTRRRNGAFQGPELRRNRLAWHASLDAAWESEIGMVEGIEHLRVKPDGQAFGQQESLRQVHIRVGKVRSADSVSAGIAKLAVSRSEE